MEPEAGCRASWILALGFEVEGNVGTCLSKLGPLLGFLI